MIALGACSKGPEYGKVSGRVTFQGQPLTEGNILFQQAAQGVYMTASIESDGRYRVVAAKAEGLLPGTYRVAVRPPRTRFQTGQGSHPPAENASIPQPYRIVETSGLTAQVNPGENTFNYDLVTATE